MTERLLILLSRYREASIAVVAIVLVIYFQVGSNGGFPVAARFMSVVLRDTGRLGLIAAAEVMLMITGEIDLSRRQHLLARSLRHGADVDHLEACRWPSAPSIGVLIGVLVGVDQRHHHGALPRAVADHHGRHAFPAARHRRLDLQ